MKLYLIRHAESANNARPPGEPRVVDPLLTERGLRQAEVLAEYLATGMDLDTTPGPNDLYAWHPYRFDRLYCSAMTRSMQTAIPVAKTMGVPVTVWVDVHEQGGMFLDHEDERGIVGYPGKTRAEIATEYPHYDLSDDLAVALTDDGWWTAAYEDIPTAYERVERVVTVLRDWASHDENIAVISHGAFMSMLLKTLLGRLPHDAFSFPHFNTAISKLDFRSDGRIVVVYTNRIHFMPLELLG
jgi:2,3-bisphosphoglycerate-dependent phosphoglycerate mutase